MAYLDRFIVGLQLPLREVAIYAAPGEIPNRLLMVPYALLGTLFPQVAALPRGSVELRVALGQSVRWLAALMTPLVLVGVAFAVPAMELWLGAENGARAGVILQVLLAGLWLSSLAMGPITVVQAAAELRPLALFYLAQLPVLVLLLWVLTERFGILGAAAAMALRQLIDTVGMLWLAVRQVGRPPGRWARFSLGVVASALLLLGVAMAHTWAQAAMAAAIGLLLGAALAWSLWLEATEREQLRQQLRTRLRRGQRG
jgi:O-antigen/teichoic acid export membrane protein